MRATYVVACQNRIIYSLRARENRQGPVPPMYSALLPKNERLRAIENRMSEKIQGTEIKKDNMIEDLNRST